MVNRISRWLLAESMRIAYSPMLICIAQPGQAFVYVSKREELTFSLNLEIHHDSVAKNLDQPADVPIKREVLQTLLVCD